MAGQSEPSGEEHRRRREKFVRAAARPAGAPSAGGAGSAVSESPLGEVAQLREELAKMSQQMQKAFVDRPPMGESAGATQFPGPYAVPPPQFVQSGYAQLPPPMPLVPTPPPWQQTMASGPVVMPAPQTVVPPHCRPGSATGLASNSAATRSFAPR